jgi:threonylcarbamoyladenosine tRNA methylthiotransferase MtaB
VKIHLDSVGCRLNQSEIEWIAVRLAAAGHQLSGDPAQCDVAILNTCTVTSAAAADSRSKARRIHRLNPSADLILTGCWSSLDPQAAAALPGVRLVVGNQDKERLIQYLPAGRPPHGRQPVEPLPWRTRALIKVQDGCDQRCSYCLTTLARGPARSLPVHSVLDQLVAARARGAREAVLTGVQLSAYGRDDRRLPDLTGLIRILLDRSDIPRLRLSSLEPWGLPAAFFSLWADPRMCRQLHLPLQSGSAATLRRMRRPVTPQAYATIVAHARQAIPQVAITTDIITGFPGEDQAEFADSLDRIEQLEFSGAHLFTYSPRPGTTAASLPGALDPLTLKRRRSAVRRVVERSQRAYQQSFLGAQLQVLWESATQLGASRWELTGWSDNYLRVRAISSHNDWNQIARVKLTGQQDSVMLGEVIPASPDGSLPA